MRIWELGRLDQPVMVFGGPYSNLQATQAVFAEAKKLGIPGTHQICTGDVVAYCARPNETVDLVRQSGCAVVAGNCEQQLANGEPDCGCGFEEGTTCDILSVEWYSFASRVLSDEARNWMRDLPDAITFWHCGKRYAVVHGGHTDISRFVWSVTPEDVFEDEWDALEASVGVVDVVIAGHCGLAFSKRTRRGLWFNAGIIGMPPNDGKPQTRYAVLENGAFSLGVLAYDEAAAQQDMREAGLCQGYDTSLVSGYWPSEDILPDVLRRSAAPAKG